MSRAKARRHLAAVRDPGNPEPPPTAEELRAEIVELAACIAEVRELYARDLTIMEQQAKDMAAMVERWAAAQKAGA
jgi:hypothetical protein